MRGKRMLWRDQYGSFYITDTVKELCERLGYRSHRSMFVDGRDGKTYRVGVVVGPFWLHGFTPMRTRA